MRKQQGLGMTATLVIAMVIIFVAIIIARIVPLYMENHAIKDILAGLKEQPLIFTQSDNEIKETLNKELRINNIADIAAEEISITRSDALMVIEINHEAHAHILGNFDGVVTFHNKVEVSPQ